MTYGHNDVRDIMTYGDIMMREGTMGQMIHGHSPYTMIYLIFSENPIKSIIEIGLGDT